MADTNKTTENMGMSLEDLDFDFDDDAIMKMMENAHQDEEPPKPTEPPKAMSLDDLDFNFDDDAIMSMMSSAKETESEASESKSESNLMLEEVPESVPEPKSEPPKKEISSFKTKMDGVYRGIRYNPVFSRIFTGTVGKGIGELERLYEDPELGVSKNSIKLAIGSLMIVSVIINEKKKGKKKFYTLFRKNPKTYIKSFASSETVKNFVDEITSSHEKLEEFGQNYGAEINRLNNDYTTEVKNLKTKKMEEAAEQAAKAIKEPEREIVKDPVIHEKLSAFYEKVKDDKKIRDILAPSVVFFNNAIEQVLATGADNVKQQIIRDGLSAMMIFKIIEDEKTEDKKSMFRVLKANPSATIKGFSDSNVVKKCAYMLICDQERIRLFASELDSNLKFLSDAYLDEVQKKKEAKLETEKAESRSENEQKRKEHPEVLKKLDEEVSAIFKDGILSTYIKEAILEGKSALERLYYEHDINIRLKSLREGISAMMLEYQIRSERKLGISMTALLLDREPVSCFEGFTKSRTVNIAAIRLLKNPEEIKGFALWLDINMDALNKLLSEEKRLKDEDKVNINEERLLEVLKLDVPEPEEPEAETDPDDYLIKEIMEFGLELSKDEPTTIEELEIDEEAEEILANAADPEAPLPDKPDAFLELFGDLTLDEAQMAQDESEGVLLQKDEEFGYFQETNEEINSDNQNNSDENREENNSESQDSENTDLFSDFDFDSLFG